ACAPAFVASLSLHDALPIYFDGEAGSRIEHCPGRYTIAIGTGRRPDDLSGCGQRVRVAGAKQRSLFRLIKALFIDLDGVIRIWEPRYIAEVEEMLGLPQGAYANAAFAPELIKQVTTGRITAEEWRAETGRRLRETHPELDVAE